MMRRKYPSAAAGRSALLEKRLSRGVPKFFDSGDYNLAKAANDPKHKNKVTQCDHTYNQDNSHKSSAFGTIGI